MDLLKNTTTSYDLYKDLCIVIYLFSFGRDYLLLLMLLMVLVLLM